MTLFPRLARPSPIGLDIGPRAISAIQLDRSGAIAAAAYVPRRHAPEGTPPTSDPAQPASLSFSAADAAALDDVLYRHAFVGRDAILTVPDDLLLSDVLELPPRSSGAPIDQLARMEVVRAHKLNPDALEIATWDIPAPARTGSSGAAATHLMTAACTHDSADALLAPFESAGFRIVALDSRVWALARACAPILPPAGLAAIIDLREDSALLAFTAGGPRATPMYQRVMGESGISRLRARIRESLQVSPEIADHLLDSQAAHAVPAAEPDPSNPGQRATDAPHAEIVGLIAEHAGALGEEVRTALDYAAHRYPRAIERVVVCGAGAAISGVAAQLESRLGVPVQTAAPADLAFVADQLTPICRNPAMTAALGLAEWGAEARSHPIEKGRTAA